MNKLGLWLRTNSLWAAALGLMLASSGLDGTFLAKIMPPGLEWLGYTLNTMSDLAGLILVYWFGVFRQSPKNTKRYKLALVLLPAELVAVSYSWYFGYLQLLLVLPAVIQGDVRGVARVSAGFIPLLLAFIGFAQSLLAGKWDTSHTASQPKDNASGSASDAPKDTHLPQKATEPAKYVCDRCGKGYETPQSYAAHRRWCKAGSE